MLYRRLWVQLYPALEIQHREERERVLEEAVRFAFANCEAKEVETITEGQHNRLVGLLWEKLEPSILNQLTGRHRRD